MHPHTLCAGLISRARYGDQEALNSVADSLRPRLRRMAQYYSRHSPLDADDLLQEAWCGVFESLPDLNPAIGNADSHLVARARWRMLDSIRRELAIQRRALELNLKDDPHTRECLAESLAACEFADSLPDMQRRVLIRLLLGLTWRECGAALDCSAPNVAYHVRQIRARYTLEFAPAADGGIR